jgi:hypothetical protein
MKAWVLYDTSADGEILGITGVTTDAECPRLVTKMLAGLMSR